MNATATAGATSTAPADPDQLFAVWDVTPATVTAVRRPSACELCQACWWPRARRAAQTSIAVPVVRLTGDAMNGVAGEVPS